MWRANEEVQREAAECFEGGTGGYVGEGVGEEAEEGFLRRLRMGQRWELKKGLI